jgi:hypothetical protein
LVADYPVRPLDSGYAKPESHSMLARRARRKEKGISYTFAWDISNEYLSSGEALTIISSLITAVEPKVP